MYFFSIPEKGDQQNIGPGSFKICQHTCFNIWIGHQEKTALGFLKISKYTFS